MKILWRYCIVAKRIHGYIVNLKRKKTQGQKKNIFKRIFNKIDNNFEMRLHCGINK